MPPAEPNSQTQRLRAIFTAARKIPTGRERADYLTQACGEDSVLLRKVEALLQAENEAESFLADYVQVPPMESPDSIIGTNLDDYLIIEHLGEGGFADVYRAEQLEPIHRQVALKLIKPGMGSREIVNRFSLEREALARMDHPNVARIYDAGTTADGRPYFAMDLVCGLPITRYCKEKGLSQEARIQLFRTVCSAVQHAHQKGVLHRDLKPSNIIVVEKDGEAMPMVIDFGIAKLLGSENRDSPLVTRIGTYIGTPAYMSPEQICKSKENFDTRTDVYSLGIILYELLTGVKPFDWEALDRTDFAEVRRIICDEFPDKPSTRVRKIQARAGRGTAGRSGELPTLARSLRGDLDWIVMKAIEKEPGRRYQGAGELDRDLERHLSKHPVEAGAPGKLYRLGKFVRRHAVGAGIAAVVFPLLLIGLILAIVGFSRARKERDKALVAEFVAEVETAQALTYKTLLLPYFEESLRYDLEDSIWWHPEDVVGAETPHIGFLPSDLRHTLAALVNDVDSALHGQPCLEATVRKMLAESYLNLGMYQDSWRQLEICLDLHREIYGPGSIEYANILAYYAFALNGRILIVPKAASGIPNWQQKRLPLDLSLKAARMCREAISIYRSQGDKGVLYAKCLASLGTTLPYGDEKESNYRELRATVENLQQRAYETLDMQGSSLAYYLNDTGRQEEAMAIFEQVESKADAYEVSPMGSVNRFLKWNYLYSKPFSETEAVFRKYIQFDESLVGGELREDYPFLLSELDRLLEDAGRPDPEIKRKLAIYDYRRANDPGRSRVDYSVLISQPGTYRLYVRWDGHNIWSDSLIVRLKGILLDGVGGSVADYYGFTRMANPPDADFASAPEWQGMAGFETLDTGTHIRTDHLGRLTFVEGRPEVPAEWTIETPGLYTLQFLEVEPGVGLDALVFQLSSLPAPRGEEMKSNLIGPDNAYEVMDGRVVVEAEEYTGCYNKIGSSWTFVPVEEGYDPQFLNFRGEGYLQLLPDPYWITPDKLARSHSIEFDYEGRWDTSLAYFNEAVRLDPSHENLYNRGWMYEATGNYNLAAEDYNRFLELSKVIYPENVPIVVARLRRSTCWLRTGQYDAVIKDWENPPFTAKVPDLFEEMRDTAAQAYARLGLWDAYDTCMECTDFPEPAAQPSEVASIPK